MLLAPREFHILALITADARHASSVGRGGSQSRATPIVFRRGDVTQERSASASLACRRAAVPRGGGSSVVEVKLDDVDRIEWALKTFKKKVQRAGVLQDLRRKRHYVKPSEARQQKAAAARRRKRSRG